MEENNKNYLITEIGKNSNKKTKYDSKNNIGSSKNLAIFNNELLLLDLNPKNDNGSSSKNYSKKKLINLVTE